jgi:hypothetical protein
VSIELAELVSLHVRDSQIKGSATRRERTLDAEERGENVVGASGEEEGLTRDEANIIKGVLDMKIKTVDKCMTPLEKVFMLSLADKLDEKTMDKVRRRHLPRSHTRTPTRTHSFVHTTRRGATHTHLFAHTTHTDLEERVQQSAGVPGQEEQHHRHDDHQEPPQALSQGTLTEV